MSVNFKNNDLPILIVDDNRQYASVLTRILDSAFGYKNVTAVHSTEEALELMNKDPEKFKLLFVDYVFPSGKTGGELLNHLHDNGLLEDKVSFLITSEPTVDNLKEASRAGALGVVAKPFDRKELQKQLEKAARLQDIDDAGTF